MHAQCKPLRSPPHSPAHAHTLVQQPLHSDASKGHCSPAGCWYWSSQQTRLSLSHLCLCGIFDDFFGLLWLLDFGSSSILHLGRSFHRNSSFQDLIFQSIECYHYQFPFSSSWTCTLVPQGQSWLVLSMSTLQVEPKVGGMEAEPWAPQPLSWILCGLIICPVVLMLESSFLHPLLYSLLLFLRLGLNVTSSVKASLNTFSKGYSPFLLLFISNPFLFPLQEPEMWNNFYSFCSSFLLNCFTVLKLETHLSWLPLSWAYSMWPGTAQMLLTACAMTIWILRKGKLGFPGQRALWLPWG